MTKALKIKNDIKNVPAHLKDVGPTGNENIGSDDLTIPRLSVLQDLSPEVKKSNPKYVEGAEAGMILNLLTKELFKDVRLVPVYCIKEYPIFIKRTKGGGYKGNFPSKSAAQEFVDQQPVPEDLDIVETANHYCLMLDDDGEIVSQVLFPMSSTKLQFSRSWNSIILQRHDARFACSWQIGTIIQKNAKGEFYNLAVKDQGEWVSPEVFKEAQSSHETLSSSLGKKT